MSALKAMLRGAARVLVLDPRQNPGKGSRAWHYDTGQCEFLHRGHRCGYQAHNSQIHVCECKTLGWVA